MCFSAGASFTAGAVLSVIGIVSLKKVQRPSQKMFAAIPLLFAAQQFTEGILWLSLPDPSRILMQQITTWLFIFFAQVIWPFWVPVSILLLEKKLSRKKSQQILALTGIAVSAYLLFCLLAYPVEARIDGYHISYKQHYPELMIRYGSILYIAAIIGPCFFSHVKRMWMLGATTLISYLITAFFYENYVLSVWCFFASLISISVLIIMFELKKKADFFR